MKLTSITITTGIFPPDIGGPASFIPIFASLLVQKGMQVEVITLADKEEDYSAYPFKVIAISRKIKKPLRDVLVIAKIVKSAKKSDLIFSNTLAFESAMASQICGKKLVQKIVGDLAWERANGSGRFSGTLEEYQVASLDYKSKLTNIYRNYAVQHSSLIITPSQYLKTIVRTWGYPQKQTQVIYNAVEFDASDTKIAHEKFRIVTVARLIPHKGIEAILRAIAQLHLDIEYIIIGDGPLRASLESLAKHLNIQVNFIGNISKSEVANCLSSSDLFILNSSYEGLPHVVLEAMQNSCPVLASRVGGTPEVIKDGENGVLFEYNNTEELSSKIQSLFTNEKLREKLIQNARISVENFTGVEKMVDVYVEVIEGVLQNGS